MDNNFPNLSEAATERVNRATEMGMKLMKEQGIPFLTALFHPDVLKTLRGDVNEQTE